MNERDATARDAGDGVTPPRARSPLGDRWAVIVGISDYRDDRLTLRYAHRDAEELRSFLLTGAGGGFEPERMQLLLDSDATTRNVTRAIRTFLSRTREDDFVLIYFACHGAPDASVPAEPLYILTHDSDLDDIAGTALPMDELQWNLRHYVSAKRVVIFADTCHSAGVATPGARGTARGSDLTAAALNQYLKRLSESTPGVAYLTSATATQRSYEDESWGGGHGAFTWYLLEGMRGKADGHGGRPRDGIVTLGELAGYVRDRVFEATNRRQEPNLGGTGGYDAELPLSVVGGLDAEQHVRLAQAFLEVGWLLDDPAPFRCAAHEASYASELARLAGASAPQADALAGEALLAAGASPEAAAVLGPARERFGDELPADASLHHGLALAEMGREEEAADCLKDFAERAGEHPEVPWAADYADWLRAAAGARAGVHAVLVGIGKQASGDLGELYGPPNDLVLVRELLTSTLGVAPGNVTTLADAEATRDAIEETFRSLRDVVGETDTVLFYFSGHAAAEGGRDALWLVTHDLVDGNAAGFSPADFHRVVAAMPGAARVLLIDTHGNQAFTDLLVADPVAAALVGSTPGEMAYELAAGPDGRHHGAFTSALVSAWRAARDPREMTLGELRDATRAGLRELGPHTGAQTPALVGKPTRAVLEGGYPGAAQWRLTRVRAPRSRPPGAGSSPRPVASDDPWAWLAAAESGVRHGRAEDAERALTKFAATDSSTRWGAEPSDAQRAVAALRRARPRALLVGIGSYADPAVPAISGALSDVAAMRKLLVGRGFRESDITVLEDGDATRAAVLGEFGRLAEAAREELAAFFIAGVGSQADGQPSVLPYDARSGGASDITLLELANDAADAPNLVTIIDAGVGASFDSERWRAAAPSADDVMSARGIVPLTPAEQPSAIGAVTVLAPVAPQARSTPPDDPARRELTTALVDALAAPDPPESYEQWVARVPTELGAVAMGPASAEPILSHRTLRDAALAALRQLGRAPARVAEDLARRAVVRSQERKEQAPLSHLELGLALAAADRIPEAIAQLRTARNLYEDESVREQQAARDPDVEVWRREARYHLGRLLQETGERPEDLSDAVATLQAAHGDAPEDPRILLHLGLAIRDQVERHSLVEVSALLRAYVDAGAPLGRLDEITALIEQPAAVAATPSPA